MLGSPGAKEVMPYGGGYADALPAVRRMYNIYHPYDPIAYRFDYFQCCAPALRGQAFDC
jgi:hypothetical protein